MRTPRASLLASIINKWRRWISKWKQRSSSKQSTSTARTQTRRSKAGDGNIELRECDRPVATVREATRLIHAIGSHDILEIEDLVRPYATPSPGAETIKGSIKTLNSKQRVSVHETPKGSFCIEPQRAETFG